MKQSAIFAGLVCLMVLCSAAAKPRADGPRAVARFVALDAKGPAGNRKAIVEIENRSAASLEFDGYRQADGFYVSYPAAYLEARDVHGTWIAVDGQPPGSFFQGPNRLKIGPNRHATVLVDMMPSTVLVPDSVRLQRPLRLHVVLHPLDRGPPIISEPFPDPRRP